MMRKSLSRLIAAVSFSALVPFYTASALTQGPLQAEPDHKNTIVEIMESLKLGHYKQMTVDDALSSKLLDKYLDDLDPSRSYFYASDVDSFQRYRKQLDDDLLDGDLTAAYEIFNTYQARNRERLTYALELTPASAHGLRNNDIYQ